MTARWHLLRWQYYVLSDVESGLVLAHVDGKWPDLWTYDGKEYVTKDHAMRAAEKACGVEGERTP